MPYIEFVAGLTFGKCRDLYAEQSETRCQWVLLLSRRIVGLAFIAFFLFVVLFLKQTKRGY